MYTYGATKGMFFTLFYIIHVLIIIAAIPYGVTASFGNSFGLGSVDLVSKDSQHDIYIYDSVNSRIMVLDESPTKFTPVRIMPLDNPIKLMATTRQEGILVDSQGFVRFEDGMDHVFSIFINTHSPITELSFNISWVDRTCDLLETPGYIHVTISGGHFPY